MSGMFEDHLSLDAVVAYADGELSMSAFQRAAAHLVRCEACAAEVNEQLAAQKLLQAAGLPRMSGSLFDALRSIPVAMPAPAPIDPLVACDGPLELQPRGLQPRTRRFRLGGQ